MLEISVDNGGTLAGIQYKGGNMTGWLDAERTLGANMKRAKLQNIDLDKIIDIDIDGLMLDTDELHLRIAQSSSESL